MANKIQIKRGLESNINKSNLLQGELAVTTDSNKLYVGTSKGPIQLNKDDESLVIIDYYETDESKKEKIKSLFIKEDGTPSEHQLVKPCILLAPTVEPTSTTSIYTKGQWICAFGDTESNLINELTNERAITKYDLIFMTMDMGLNLIYNVSEDTITYTWTENALEATYNKITKIGTPETINDKHYPSEKAVYDYVNEKVVQSDYNQNDATASNYIKNRPCYDIEPTITTLLDLPNPVFNTWQVLKTFESYSDQKDYMTNLSISPLSLSLDGRDLGLPDIQHIPENISLESQFNFPSDLYYNIRDCKYFEYPDYINKLSINILLVPCEDNNSIYKLMYYISILNYSGSDESNTTLKNLVFTIIESNTKMMEDKYLYSIVDTSDDLNLYAYDYQKKFTKRNNISDLTTQPTVTPKPSIVATDTGELYLVSFDWENRGEPI